MMNLNMAHMDFLFEHVHPASLSLTRILFGFLMLFDIPAERGGSEIDIRWGDPMTCSFPLFSFMPRPSYPWMCILYGIMWLGALGICLGFKFRASCAFYLLPYWYILFLDKTFWNNHSYLYGLLGILMMVSNAGEHLSIDAFLHSRGKARNEKQDGVPFWNYFLLRFQLFCLYFFAGLKKLDMEWLEGYSMANMGTHWVFDPFGLIFTTEQIDYLVIHISGFLLDLTIGFFLLYGKTRPLAMVFCGMFHLMNSRLFSIGMFPYVCIVTMPIFCDPDWPIVLITRAKKAVFTKEQDGVQRTEVKQEETINKPNLPKPETSKSPKVTFLIVLYCLVQMFLPWSHFITKGNNNWTNGIYGYSWDMMVHSWHTTLVIVKVIDNENGGKEMFLDPTVWVHNDRWNKHADMLLQYAECMQENFKIEKQQKNIPNSEISNNISIYVDVWCSLNGRFQQRMFDPNYDLLKANWSPFSNVEWLLPILYEYSDFREKMKLIQEEVYSWSNYSEVLFIADFPGLYLDNFITEDLTNISLVIIEGTVLYEIEDEPTSARVLNQGDRISLKSNVFHKVKTISKTPSCFMYTFINGTLAENPELYEVRRVSSSPFPLIEDSPQTIEDIAKMFELVSMAVLHLLYDEPMLRRAIID